MDINVTMVLHHSGRYQIIFILIHGIHHHNVHVLIGLMMLYQVKIILVNIDIQILISHALPQIYQPPISGWDHQFLFQQCLQQCLQQDHQSLPLNQQIIQ